MFPAGIYYVQTRGCASSVRAGFSLLTGSVYIYVLIQKTICNRGVCLSLIRERRRFAPPKPKRRIDDKPENPEGESLRGSLVFTTEASVEVYSYQGIKKNRPEPKFKGVCKKSVLIEI